MRTLRTKLWRDLRRQRPQFAAIAVTIFLGVTLFGASYDAFRNLDASYESAFTEYRFANLTVSGGNTDRIAARAGLATGVEDTAERVEADLPLRVDRAKLLGRVVGLPASGQPAVNRVDLESGSYLSPERPRGVLVEQHMAENFELEPGDALAARSAGGGEVTLEVLGIAASPEYFWPARSRQDLLPAPDDFGVVFAPEALAEELAGLGGPNQVAIYYRDGEEDAGLTEQLTGLAERAGAADVLTRELQPSNSALQQDVKSFEELAVLFPLLFLTAAALATGVLMRRVVTAQRPIVGMLRAAGYSRARLLRHYLSFGVITGLGGGILGAAAGLLLAGAVTNLYTEELSIPISLTELHPVTPLVGIGFGLLTGLIAAGAPAWSAASTPPAEAMRRFAPSGRGKISLAERLLPPLRRVPVHWRMSLRSLGRNRRQTFSTILGVVLALVLILVSWGMVDTAQILLDRQFETIERQDAQLIFEDEASPAQLRDVRESPGVERAEPALEVPVSLAADGERYRTALIALEPDTEMHSFLLADGDTTELPAAGLLAGEALADELAIGTGDEIAVSVPGVAGRVDSPVEGFVAEPLGTYVYASLDAVAAATGARAPVANAALVRFAADADRDEMRRRLSRIPGVVAYEDSQALLETANSYLGLYYAFVGMMLVFGGAMAFALLFNSMTSNIAERSVEVATMRAAGTPYRTLARMITAENVLVTLIGIVPGLLAGYWVAKLFLGSFSSDQFSFDLEMRTSTYVLSALAILLVALLSQRPGLRSIKRLDVAEVVRERAA